MTRTFAILRFGENALEVADDATLSVDHLIEAYSDLEALRLGTVSSLKYATFEPDYWLLDGSFDFPPTANGQGGWVTKELSSAVAPYNYIAPHPQLTLNFSEPQSTSGLHFVFSNTGDYSDFIRVAFYDASLVNIQDNDYFPTGPEFSTNQAVTGFKRIIIFLQSSSKPQRRARLMRLDLDTLTQYAGDRVKAANLVDEISQYSIELPSSSFEATLLSDSGEFSIVNPAGVYATFSLNLPFDVLESVNGLPEYIGRFYLRKWKSKSVNEADIEAVNVIGLMDSIDYLPEIFETYVVDPLNDRSGGSAAEVMSQDLIADIMLQAGVNYTLDPALEEILISPSTITGKTWLPVDSCRVCLQLVLLRMGAHVTTSRSNVVHIKPSLPIISQSSYDYTLTPADIKVVNPLELKPLVSGVEITTHDYTYDNTSSLPWVKLGALPIGVFIITFDEPHSPPFSLNFAPPGAASITRYGSTWLEITTTSAVSFLNVSAFNWTDTPIVTGVYSVPGSISNIMKLDATSVNRDYASYVAGLIYSYFQERYLITVKTFSRSIEVGKSAIVDTQGEKFVGWIERVETDLAGGFVSKSKMTGIIRPSDFATYLTKGKYDQDHASIVYDGAWTLNANVGDYGGDTLFTTTLSGQTATFKMFGVQFKIIFRSPGGGTYRRFSVTVDGTYIGIIDQSGASGSQQEWLSPLLIGQVHTVVLKQITVAGFANDGPNVDAVEIL